MTMGENENKKPKKELAIGNFLARTTQFFLAQFDDKKNGGKRVLLAIEVEFEEGPNIGLKGTLLLSQANLEFFVNTLVACGWTQGTDPTKTKPGRKVRAVVDKDVNPNNNEVQVRVKFINDINGRPSALAEKFGVSEKETDDWNKSFQATLSQFVRSTGFTIPKPTQQESTNTQASSKTQTQGAQPETQGAPADDVGGGEGGGDSAEDDDIPF